MVTKKELLHYGFDQEQAGALLKGKKVDTPHGIYSVREDSMYLTNHDDKETNKIELD